MPAGSPGFPAGFPAGQFCPPSSVSFVRLDNRAPGSPSFAANPNGRQNGWINDAVGLNAANTGSSGTVNNWIANGTADLGIGGSSTTGAAYQRWLRFGDPGAAGIIDAARAATASDAATLPAPTATNITVCAIVTARDQLGNESTRGSDGDPCTPPPVAGNGAATGINNIRFGVDIDEPTIDYAASSIADQARQNGGAIWRDVECTTARLRPELRVRRDGRRRWNHRRFGYACRYAGSRQRYPSRVGWHDLPDPRTRRATASLVLSASSNTVCSLGTLLNNQSRRLVWRSVCRWSTR